MLELFILIVVLVLDQASKIACAAWLPTLQNHTYPLIDGVFELAYVENRGAAFGMLQNARWLFIPLTIVACVALVWLLIKKRGSMPVMLRVCVALIVAGALGNFIDRLFLGYVRDMFYFSLIDFAVFNVADAAITIGGIFLVVELLFTKEGRAFFAELDKKPDPKMEAATTVPDEGTQRTEKTSAKAEQDGDER